MALDWVVISALSDPPVDSIHLTLALAEARKLEIDKEFAAWRSDAAGHELDHAWVASCSAAGCVPVRDAAVVQER